MLANRFLLQLAVATGVVLSHPAQATCVAPGLVFPTETEINEASPRIEWTPVANAAHYLVWLESRVPEGRVLVSEEFQTGATYFIPPRPLTTGKATVRIRVTAICKDETRSTLSTRLRIDADSACKLKAAPTIGVNNEQLEVHWQPLPNAQRYEVRMHAAEDGKPLLTRESNGNKLRLDLVAPGLWLLAVQPVCRGLKGVTRWVVLETR